MDTTDPPLFISYKSEDRALAEDLYRHLTAAGFDVWFDVEALDRVALWHDLIEAGCDNARLILPVLTPRWQSLWTEYETYGGEAVVPLVFEGEFAQVAPPALQEWQGMAEDMREATDETWKRLFKRLRDYLAERAPEKSARVDHLPIAANRYFVGREAALLELHAQLCQAPTTVLTHGPAFVLEGLGGVGKTTLARHYAEKFWRLYRDLLWVSAANPELLPLEFARVAEKLGVAVGDDVDANARRALDELTRGPRRLLIMDNAHDEESIQDWLPKTGKCRTIITSRFTAWSAEVQTMHVHVLEPGPAQDLLIRRSGVADSEANRAMADELAKELGYLPLALEQAAAYIHQQHGTLEHYLEQYAQHRQRLLARRQPGATRYPDSVATTWQISVEQLGPQALDMLRLLAFVAPAPLPRWVLRQAGDVLGDLDELAVDEAVGELHRYSLIELQDEDGPLTIHRLLQAVQEDGLEVGERKAWVEKALRVVERAFPEADYSNWQVCEELLPHALACSARAQKYEVLTREAGLLPLLVGHFFRERGQVSAALAPLVQATAVFERLAAADPGNAAWQRDLSVSHERIGDVRVAQGDLSGALETYQDSLDIRERLAAADPGNAAWQRDLSVSHNKLGDVRVAQGDLSGALEAYQDSLDIRERLAAADPGNAAGQYDLGICHERIGDVRMAEGDLAGALAAFEAKHAIIQRLAAADPGNAAWQRDLAAAHCFVGMVLQAQGDLTAALTAYEAYRETMERLAAADPGNAAWQRDLSVGHERIGDVRVAQGDLSGALEAYQDSLDIAQRLAAADPGNAAWQRDLAVSFYKLAAFHNEANQEEQAVARLLECREVLRGMRDRGMHLDPPAVAVLEQLEGLGG